MVVDIQGDFTTLKKGALAVAGADRVYVDQVEAAANRFKRQGYKLFATQDWHPPNHVSFYTNHSEKKPFDVIEISGRSQVLWPPHCVQHTENAKLLLDTDLFEAVVQKGMNPRYDSYSGFQDDGGDKTQMDDLLKRHHIKAIIIFGLATDYCVRATSRDALRIGYEVAVIESLCRGVAEDTTRQAIVEMKTAGVKLIEPSVS